MTSETSFNLGNCFRDISPCETQYDDWNHRPLIATNEVMRFDTIILEKATGNTMIATSGMFALNLFALREMGRDDSDQVINLVVIDCGVRVAHFWNEMAGIIQSSNSQKEVIEKIQILLKTHKERYFSGGCLESTEVAYESALKSLQGDIDKAVSWLSEEPRFKKIKRLFAENRFTFLRLDFYDSRSMVRVGLSLSKHKLILDSIYVSNIYEYTIINDPIQPVLMQMALQQSFRKGMAVLISPTTFVVDTQPRICYQCDTLTQRTRLRGKLPIEKFFEELPHEAQRLKCGHDLTTLFSKKDIPTPLGIAVMKEIEKEKSQPSEKLD